MAVQGQTINDRILAARHSIAGQGLAKAVCKATTEEIIGPKKKHLDYLLHCTNEPNVSIPTLANLLIERTQNPSWVVVFKGLITTHHLMCYGNERFTQYLASSNSNFQLSNYLDKSGVQGYDMSPFIRRYAKYMSEKSVSYRNVAFDFCKVKRGKDGGTLRTMSGDKLLKTLPHLQQQIDALLEFDCTSQDLNNGVINACFMLLFRDLIRLFACYNDGIINLLEKYFEMNKKQARDALDIYKKFLIRMDRVADFLKVAERFGIDKNEIPDLARAPSSLLEALEAHLANLEGRKPGSGGTTPTGTNRVNVAAAVSSLSNTSNAFGAAASNGGVIDEKVAEQLLQEEAAAMEKFRSTASASNPFAAAAEPETKAEETPNILDLFGVSAPAVSQSSAAAAAANGKASDDLLQLGGSNPNPFESLLNAAGSGQPIFSSSAPFSQPAATGMTSSAVPAFGSENAFNNFFGQAASGGATTGGANLFGDVLQPANSTVNTASTPKVITGDLDSSLANLASNLNFGAPNKGAVGTTPRGPPMAGINNFQNQPMGSDFAFGMAGAGAIDSNAPSLMVNASSPLFSNNSWGTSPANPGGSMFPQSPAFPTASSPFPGIPPSQSFPNFSSSGILTPSPSMPAMSSSTASPFPAQNSFNTAFLAANPAFNNNNNNIDGKIHGAPGGPGSSPAGVAGGNSDPFAGLL